MLEQHRGSQLPSAALKMGGKGKKAAQGAAKGNAEADATARDTWKCKCGGPRAATNYDTRKKCVDCGKPRPAAAQQSGRKTQEGKRQQKPPAPPQPPAAPPVVLNWGGGFPGWPWGGGFPPQQPPNAVSDMPAQFKKELK